MKNIKTLIKENSFNEALQLILQSARITADYNEYNTLCRLRRKIPEDLKAASVTKKIKLAILGGATTGFIEEPLKLEIETQGIETELFISNYNTYVTEMLDPSSETISFNPDVAFFLLTPFNIADWPDLYDSTETVDQLANQVCDHWLGLCASFHNHTNAEIVINNMHLLPTRPSGNLGSRLPGEQNSFLRQVNKLLAEKAPEYVHILDIATLSSLYGVANWFDIRFWHHSKQPVAFDCIVPFVRNLAAIIGGIYGRSGKCLVLDLDNTLWGGVIGDDGLDGIKIGEGDAIGEAFKTFQKYIKSIKDRGILLAVCSKNEESNALAPFEQLPDMILKRDDFVSFRANWEGKPANLEAIARELNIGLDALVFVDDNPAEREHVRQVLPQVKVVELSEDPADYATLLDQCGWLEPVKLTTEDKNKTEQYINNTKRQQLATQHVDYDSYLKSLEQHAVVRPFETTQLDRITQLVNKTNQFNLTTLRLNRSEIENLMNDENTLTAYIRLTDKFGDNGLISVFSGQREQDILDINIWLMSCRVFKRGVEYLLTNYIMEKAKSVGIRQIRGHYIPTAKNKLVANLYPELGFNKIDTSEDDETTRWVINVDDYEPRTVHFDLSEET